MKIAVIGGGIFGATTAIKLAQAGFSVDLYEKNKDILMAASGINQYRLHRGYHYPRSISTANSSRMAEPCFQKEYQEAIINTKGSYYVIAKENNKVNFDEFTNFCKQCNLEYEVSGLEFVNKDSIEAIIKVKESIVDPVKLREIVRKRLKDSGVNLFLGSEFTGEMVDLYDVVVNASYANLNFILEKYPEEKREYQFEICEKLLLELPSSFRGLSVVVIDGPFFCIDPYTETGFHVMGNVVHAIHKSNNGFFPEIPDEFKDLLNKGIIENPRITNFSKFIDSASFFIPEMKKAKHIGSMYTVRTVLPNVDHTDERPTLVYRVDKKIINIFSGKIGNSVQAATDTLEMIENIKKEG